MLLTHCLNVLKGEVPDVYLTGLNEIKKVAPIGFPPLLCIAGRLGLYLGALGRPDCVVCWLKNDEFAT
jgi:hypothetical protein